MKTLKYLAGYRPEIQTQVSELIASQSLGEVILARYPKAHELTSDRALYGFTQSLKQNFLKKSSPLSKVIYDDKIHVIHHALGLHSYVSRVQGNKLKSKHEIRVAAVFKKVPEAFLKMIVVHELAHLKEKQHNKAFYKLCQYMEPEYHQFEFDMRLYLTHIDEFGMLY